MEDLVQLGSIDQSGHAVKPNAAGGQRNAEEHLGHAKWFLIVCQHDSPRTRSSAISAMKVLHLVVS